MRQQFFYFQLKLFNDLLNFCADMRTANLKNLLLSLALLLLSIVATEGGVF
jgi:hypothetical protein